MSITLDRFGGRQLQIFDCDRVPLGLGRKSAAELPSSRGTWDLPVYLLIGRANELALAVRAAA